MSLHYTVNSKCILLEVHKSQLSKNENAILFYYVISVRVCSLSRALYCYRNVLTLYANSSRISRTLSLFKDLISLLRT